MQSHQHWDLLISIVLFSLNDYNQQRKYSRLLMLDTGIACLHLKFVDGRGNPIQLISSPKPSPHAYKDMIDKHMFDGMVQTSLYEVKPGSRSPGRVI